MVSGNPTMRAIVVEELGGPEALQVATIPVPPVGPEQVLIETVFAGINFSEVYARRGQAPGFTPPFVPGLEVSGIVRAVGSSVTTLSVGSPVAAFCRRGGYAEFVVADEQVVFPLESADPDHLLTGAVFPTSVITAWLLLSRAASVRPGETVLIHAAAGALGMVGAQVARYLGAGRVLGTTSTPAKAERALSGGYDVVYLRSQWTEQLTRDGWHERVDVAVESIGGQTLRETAAVLAPLGRVLVCGNASWSDDVTLPASGMWLGNRIVAGFNIGALSAANPGLWREQGLQALRLVFQGDISVAVDGVFELGDAAVAHARLEAGQTTGKLVLRIGDPRTF